VTRHRFDPLSFLFGVAFIIVALGSLEGGHIGGLRTESISSLSVAALGATLVVWAIVAIARKDPPAVAASDPIRDPGDPVSMPAPTEDEPATDHEPDQHRS
jgi:hypothetical protein